MARNQQVTYLGDFITITIGIKNSGHYLGGIVKELFKEFFQ